MKLLCWNVNGIRAISGKGFFEWVEAEQADIICLQETKAHPSQLDAGLVDLAGYRSFWSSAERKGYSGVAVYSRAAPQVVTEGLGIEEFDREGRTLILDFGGFMLCNLYFPNGGDENRRVPFKLAFYDAFLERVDGLRRQGRRIVICGDFNTAHKEIDLARPKENVTNTGFLPEERAWIDRFVAHGYVDTFRVFTQEGGHYSWWDYKTYARKRNVGWRLDYFFITDDLLPHLEQAFIQPHVMGSDHCPVGVVLRDAIIEGEQSAVGNQQSAATQMRIVDCGMRNES